MEIQSQFVAESPLWKVKGDYTDPRGTTQKVSFDTKRVGTESMKAKSVGRSTGRVGTEGIEGTDRGPY